MLKDTTYQTTLRYHNKKDHLSNTILREALSRNITLTSEPNVFSTTLGNRLDFFFHFTS